MKQYFLFGCVFSIGFFPFSQPSTQSSTNVHYHPDAYAEGSGDSLPNYHNHPSNNGLLPRVPGPPEDAEISEDDYDEYEGSGTGTGGIYDKYPPDYYDKYDDNYDDYYTSTVGTPPNNSGGNHNHVDTDTNSHSYNRNEVVLTPSVIDTSTPLSTYDRNKDHGHLHHGETEPHGNAVDSHSHQPETVPQGNWPDKNNEYHTDSNTLYPTNTDSKKPSEADSGLNDYNAGDYDDDDYTDDDYDKNDYWGSTDYDEESPAAVPLPEAPRETHDSHPGKTGVEPDVFFEEGNNDDDRDIEKEIREDIFVDSHHPNIEVGPVFESPILTTAAPEGAVAGEMDQSIRIQTQKDIERQVSIFAQPGILAAFIGGAVIGLLCAILLVMFIVYRMRKRDEGSYPLNEAKRMPLTSSYAANDKEIYA